MSIKLNIGCGTDYREGYINIDGSSTLGKVDKVVDIGGESLLVHFGEGTINYILANDIVEHLFRWEAVRLLKDFYSLLVFGGSVEIRVPDCEYIIESKEFTISDKLLLLFGGQDIPQGNAEMDVSRVEFPQYFCHKYGWTKESMVRLLSSIGFGGIDYSTQGTNIVITAKK